ncbi:MAG: 1-acyl-sn-glycerol-3-phosphate acyltransferase [Candidatus Cryptobacteroides sp.]
MPLLSISELESMSPVFRGKAGNKLAKELMKFLSMDKVNSLFDRFGHLSGPDFTDAVFKDVGYSYTVGFPGEEQQTFIGEALSDRLASVLPEGPFITVSNHPCGHLDGMTLVDMFARVRPDYKVLVNKILARITTLGDNFISVTPTGESRTAPTSDSISGIKAAMRHLSDGGALGLFPSGAVSDLSLKDRCVRDRQWQEPVIRLIKKSRAPVIPVRFFDGNSPFYYSLGLISWKVRLLRLLAEVFNKRGRTMRIGIGPVITPEQQLEAASRGIDSLSALLRSSVYDMAVKP